MSGVGFAVGIALACAAGTVLAPRWIRRVTLATIATLILGMAFMSPVNRLQWIAIYSAERYLHSWVMVSPPPREAHDVFFINEPFVNVYCKPNLVSRLGPQFEDARVHVLTYAPKGLMMTERSILTQLDERSFTIEIEDNAWFSGVLGRFMLEGFRDGAIFQTGQVIRDQDFDVEILKADRQGVWKLKFTFPKPLNDPSYCFYLTTRNCGAARIRFEREKGVRSLFSQRPSDYGSRQEGLKKASDPIFTTKTCADLLVAGHAEAASPLFETAMSADAVEAKQADMALRLVVAWMADVLGAPVQPLLDRPELSAEEWRQVRDWWQHWVDDRTLAETWLHRRDFFHLVYLRSEIDWDRWLASFVCRTDLYLTGPPYDNPRGTQR